MGVQRFTPLSAIDPQSIAGVRAAEYAAPLILKGEAQCTLDW
jgi:hypothetical protein